MGSFLKSRTSGAGVKKPLGVIPGMKRPMGEVGAPAPVGGTDIFAFAEHWGLDEEAVEGLAGVPEEVQIDIMSTFAPKNSTGNVKNLFMSFLKSRSGAKRPRMMSTMNMMVS